MRAYSYVDAAFPVEPRVRHEEVLSWTTPGALPQ